MEKRISGFLIVLSLLFVWALTGHAATITVPAGANNIQSYIDAANNYDTVLLSEGHYYLTNPILITKPLTLKGSGAHASIIHGGASIARTISIENTTDVTLWNFIVRDHSSEFAVLSWHTDDVTFASVYLEYVTGIGYGVVGGDNIQFSYGHIWHNGIVGDGKTQQAIWIKESRNVGITGLGVVNTAGGPSENGGIAIHNTEIVRVNGLTSHYVGSGGIFLNNRTRDVRIENSSFVGGSEFAFDIVNGSHDIMIINNIVDGAAAGAAVINDYIWVQGADKCWQMDAGLTPYNIRFQGNSFSNVSRNVGIDMDAVDMSTITRSGNTYTGSFYCDGFRNDPPNCSTCVPVP